MVLLLLANGSEGSASLGLLFLGDLVPMSLLLSLRLLETDFLVLVGLLGAAAAGLLEAAPNEALRLTRRGLSSLVEVVLDEFVTVPAPKEALRLTRRGLWGSLSLLALSVLVVVDDDLLLLPPLKEHLRFDFFVVSPDDILVVGWLVQ